MVARRTSRVARKDWLLLLLLLLLLLKGLLGVVPNVSDQSRYFAGTEPTRVLLSCGSI
jgi:hypothetical protein